jgi:hypothetical protein
MWSIVKSFQVSLVPQPACAQTRFADVFHMMRRCSAENPLWVSLRANRLRKMFSKICSRFRRWLTSSVACSTVGNYALELIT